MLQLVLLLSYRLLLQISGFCLPKLNRVYNVKSRERMECKPGMVPCRNKLHELVYQLKLLCDGLPFCWDLTSIYTITVHALVWLQLRGACFPAFRWQVVHGVGGLSHAQWRSFSNEHRTSEAAQNFIDGDLIETFLDLTRDEMEEVNHIILEHLRFLLIGCLVAYIIHISVWNVPTIPHVFGKPRLMTTSRSNNYLTTICTCQSSDSNDLRQVVGSSLSFDLDAQTLQVSRAMKMPVEDLCKKVEELTRLHWATLSYFGTLCHLKWAVSMPIFCHVQLMLSMQVVCICELCTVHLT